MSSQIFKKPFPYLALLIANLIWGINFVVAKITLQEFPPMSLAFLRFALASLFLAPFFYAETKKLKVEKSDFPKLIAVGILIITLNIAFFFEGIKRTTATDASILTLSIPVFSVLLGWLFLSEKVYLANLLGVILGGIGAFIIIGFPQFMAGTKSPENLFGNILILLASISWVIGAGISKKILTKYSSLVVTAIAFLVGTITLIIPAALEYIQNPTWPNQITIVGILGLTYMTLLSSISAYFLFEWALSKTPVGMANLFQYLEPVAATTLAVYFLDERISNYFIIGTIFIMFGAFLGTLAKEAHHTIHKAHRI